MQHVVHGRQRQIGRVGVGRGGRRQKVEIVRQPRNVAEVRRVRIEIAVEQLVKDTKRVSPLAGVDGAADARLVRANDGALVLVRHGEKVQQIGCESMGRARVSKMRARETRTGATLQNPVNCARGSMAPSPMVTPASLSALRPLWICDNSVHAALRIVRRARAAHSNDECACHLGAYLPPYDSPVM